MTKRRVWIIGAALLGVAGCAHSSAEVADTDLARVPPGEMQGVNAQRQEVSLANDAVARQQLNVNKAQNELDVAKNDKSVADAELDRAKSELDAAQYARDQGRTQQAQQQMNQAQSRQQVAQLHIDAAQARVDYAKAQHAAAEKQVTLANSKLEYQKYVALHRSGDPSAQELNAHDFQQKVQQAQADYRNAESQVMQQREQYQLAQQRFEHEAQRGVGGSGAVQPQQEMQPDDGGH